MTELEMRKWAIEQAIIIKTASKEFFNDNDLTDTAQSIYDFVIGVSSTPS